MLIAMLLLLVATASMFQAMGVTNGSFEDGDAHWVRATYGAVPLVIVDSETKLGNSRYLHISSSEPTDTAFGQDVAVQPGSLYRLQASIKTKGLNSHGAPVFGAIQAQTQGGMGILSSGTNHSGDTDWTRDSVYFVAPPNGQVHIALFFCGWGKGTGDAWFSDVELKQVPVEGLPMKVTRAPLNSGRISPFQYGQFIEYLCDLVPGMWAEKLYDGSFEGLSPYKFVFVKETDFKERPWYPFGQRNRLQVDNDHSTFVSGTTSKRITLTDGSPCEGGVAQDGISLNKGVACRFSIFARGSRPGKLRVRLYRGESEFAHASFAIGKTWSEYSANLIPKDTNEDATLSVSFDGPGTVWLDNASLMPEDSIGGWRKDVFHALKELRPGIIRIGGSVLDDPNLGTFEWTDTIGDPAHRTPFRAWGGLQPTGPGLEELVQLIQAVGAEPLVCLRYEKKTPKDAADEVQYFNGSVDTPMGALRAKNGHKKPYGIKYWQIGNERWGPLYWQAVPAFARAIRAVDPGVKLLSSFPSEELIKGASKDIDFVSPHQYDVADLAGSRRELEDTRSLIERYAGGKPLKAAVTEWNTTAGDAGLMRAKLWTLSNALACSRYHNLLHREADLVQIANRSNLTNSFCSGIIQTSRSDMYLTPTYYAQQLYATMSGSRPLKIQSEVPADVLPDVSATLSEDGKVLTIFAVNDRLTSVKRTMNLSDFGKANRSIEVVTLGDVRRAGHPDVANGFEEPQRVFPRVSTTMSIGGKLTYSFPELSLTVMRILTRDSSDVTKPERLRVRAK